MRRQIPQHMQYRRSDFDVTNTVQVSSADAVRRAVCDLFRQTWPHYPFDRVETAFRDFERLFNGQFPGYYGCDTVYHDLQHSLDGTLAVARLIVSYDRTHLADERLGPERAILGVVTALFHDAGYIRQTDDQTHRNGAEFTLSHVSRSAQFIGRYLPTIGMAEWVPVATKIVHFTGYEVQFDQIRLDDHRDRKLGHLIGTGDLIAQMADRCYLEKCRDRLYPEFVLGGIAMPSDALRQDLGALQLRARRAAPDAGVRRRRAPHAPGRRVRRRLPLSRIAVQRPQSVHGSDPAQPRLSRRSAAHRPLADAPARSAVLHLGAQPGAEHPLAGHRAPEAGLEEQLIIRLGAALAVGLLIGIERERSKGQGPRGLLQASAPSL